MISGFDELYLYNARENIATYLDYMVNDMGLEISEAFSLFLKSDYCKRFENGDPKVLSGMSGIEIAIDILIENNISIHMYKDFININKSAEYWTGWAIVYYQWFSKQSFKEINDIISINDLCGLYNPFHEMDIMNLVDYINGLFFKKHPNSKLKELRLKRNLSQKDLSILTNIPLRTIQEYEQRKKDINKASGFYLWKIAKILSCEIEDLFEIVR